MRTYRYIHGYIDVYVYVDTDTQKFVYMCVCIYIYVDERTHVHRSYEQNSQLAWILACLKFSVY